MKNNKSLFTVTFVLLLLPIFIACSSANSNVTAPVQTRPSVGKTLQVYRGHTESPVFSVAWSPSGKLIASAGMDNNMNLWEPISGKTVKTYPHMSGQILWSHDGKRIAITTWTAIINTEGALPVSILDAASKKVLLTFSKPRKAILSITWSPDDTRIASLSQDGEVQIWESSTGKLLKSYTAHQKTIDTEGIAWSPDGKYIASASTTESSFQTEFTIWNTRTSRTAFDYRLPVNGLSWASDSTRLRSIDDKNMVVIWDIVTGKILLRYKVHSGEVSSVAWSPDEQFIASAGDDKTVQIFNVKTGKTVFTYKGHQKRIFAVAWSPDGTKIASASEDGTIRVWEAE